MNYQFFGTAGIISGIFVVASIVFLVLWAVSCDCCWYYKTTNLMTMLGLICFLLPIAFWLVIGVLCGLDSLWCWGLVR